ncbi:protein AKNAD1 isoform X1 [Anser cygnoides]|uniref:protein AKNAD1 isoform X1 n=2 Tax=Anser cygnoides TaxID=8845 RepID=UPI000670DB51|nr:protein AKNAD1 isoform X1 [Anser cygnoides]
MPASEASFKKEASDRGFGKADGKEHLTNSKMSNVLLRHFSEGELLNTCQLIECETIPETSYTESIGETTNKPEAYEHGKRSLTPEQWAMELEGYYLEKHEDAHTGGKNPRVLNGNKFVSKRSISSTVNCGCRHDNSQLSNKYEDTYLSHNTKEQRELFKKTVSSHRLIHGQSEIHHCLPDFSKVTSELKVPKISENIKSVPTIDRTKSFPILLSQSVTVDNILENNCFHSVEVENQEEMSIPELFQQLKILPQSDFASPRFVVYSGGAGTSSEVFTARVPNNTQATQDLPDPRLPHGTMVSAFPAAGTVQVHCLSPSNLLPELKQGEKMSQILQEQTDQLKIKVEDFTKHMTHETSLSQDNYLTLNQLKKYLDALERSYLTAREEHHVLQLQNYKDKSIHVGEFDPERKVEGEIFRLGMLLEDIQEQTDDGKYSLAPSLISDESAHSLNPLWESSEVSSITDPPEETTFLQKNSKGENTTQTSDVIPHTNHLFSLEAEKCNLCPHMLQKRAESTSGREMEPLGKGYLLASKHSSSVMRFLSPEEKGLRFHTQGTLSQKCNADEENKKGNKNIQERKTGVCSIFIQRKPTDLSDTNLSTDSEDISACDSYGSQSEELMEHETESYKTFNTRLRQEKKGFIFRCPRESSYQLKHRNYKQSVQSCALCRNKNSGSTSYAQKRISTQKAQTNKRPRELVNRLSERNVNVKKLARNKPAINIRNRNTNDFNANILNSTLDHAIQTANSLKRATERMVQAISEDLAKIARKHL